MLKNHILRSVRISTVLFNQKKQYAFLRIRRSTGNYFQRSFNSKPQQASRAILIPVGVRSLNFTMRNKSSSLSPSTILYCTELSPPARAVMMVMDVLGIDKEVEKRDLNPVTREQDEPEFLKKNPMRTIPILEEEGFCLSDSHAIIIYLMEKYAKPEHAKLYPADKRKRATIHQRMFLDCGIIFPRLRAIMAPTYGGRLTELTKFMIQNIEDAYRMLEDYLSQTVFLADDVMTVADLSVVTTVSTLSHLHPVDEERFPKLKQWLKTMSEVDVCKRINEENAKLHAKSIQMVMDLNKENQRAKLENQKAKL